MDRVALPEYKRLALGESREGAEAGVAEEESGSGAAAAPAEAKDWTLTLPDELLDHILSFLPKASAASAFVVCRRWFDRSFDNLARDPDFERVSRVFDALVNTYSLEYRKSIAIGVGVLFNEETDSFYRKASFGIFEKLIEKGYQGAFDKVVNLAEETRRIKDFCRYFVEKEKVDQALQLASTISTPKRKFTVITDICVKLVEMEKVDRSVAIAKDIEEQVFAGNVFFGICEKLVDMKKVDQAIEIVEMVSDSRKKVKILTYTFDKLVDDNPDKALEVIKPMRMQSAKLQCFRKIGATFVKKGRLDDALEIAKTTLCEWEKAYVLELIAKAYFAKENFECALATAEMICIKVLPTEALRTELLFSMGRDLALKGDMKALEFFNAVSDQLLRMEYIAGFEGMIKKMPDGETKSRMLLEFASRKLDVASSQN